MSSRSQPETAVVARPPRPYGRSRAAGASGASNRRRWQA